jgi:hypothetical protein
LGACHPSQAVAVDDGQTHQFARLFGQAVDQGLRHIHDTRFAEVSQPHRYDFCGEHVFAQLAGLAHIPGFEQIIEQTVCGAFGQVQLLGHGGQFHALPLLGQQFQNGQSSIKYTAHAATLA